MHEQIQTQLSAFLDGELTQADHQRIRLHLEDCPDCREHARQLETLRRATREMQFIPPPEDRMSQLEQKISVRAPRLAGWLLLVGGLAVWVLYGLYLYIVSPRPMTWQEMTAAAVVIGVVLLLISVLRQRMLELPHDRYRGVKR